MKALDAVRASAGNETKPFRASFQAAVLALLVGFGAFFLVLLAVVPEGREEAAVPQDLFLVGTNLVPLAFVAFIVSWVALRFGSNALHFAMACLVAVFALATHILWRTLGNPQSDVDFAFLVALMGPGVAVFLAHWLFVIVRFRRVSHAY